MAPQTAPAVLQDPTSVQTFKRPVSETDSGHVCMCDRGTFFCANSATAYSPMLSPVEIGVVVICVFIVCMVAICMCAFAAKKTSMKQAEAVPPPPPDYA